MKFEETFPMSYESFKVFRPDFETCTEDSKLHLFKSKEGRLNCLKTVAYSPLTAPSQFMRRVCDLAKSLMETLGKIFEMVEHRQKDIPALKKSIKNLADYALVVVSSPVTIIAERVRYLVGVIHPRAVYKPEISVVTTVIAAVDEGKTKATNFFEKVKEKANEAMDKVKDVLGADKKEKLVDEVKKEEVVEAKNEKKDKANDEIKEVKKEKVTETKTEKKEKTSNETKKVKKEETVVATKNEDKKEKTDEKDLKNVTETPAKSEGDEKDGEVAKTKEKKGGKLDKLKKGFTNLLKSDKGSKEKGSDKSATVN